MKDVLEDLAKKVVEEDNDFKIMILEYIKKNVEKKEITIEDVGITMTEKFPEFILAIAEKNWVHGYTQALNDVEFFKGENREAAVNVSIDNITAEEAIE